MENALIFLKGLLVTAFGSVYAYLLVKLTIYAVNTSSEPLVWVLMIGGGAVLLTFALVLATFILQPAIMLLAVVFAGVGALVSRFNRRRSHV